VLALVGADALQGMRLAEVLALVAADVSQKTGSVATGGSGGGHTPIPFLHRSNAGAQWFGQYVSDHFCGWAIHELHLPSTGAIPHKLVLHIDVLSTRVVDRVTDECKCTSFKVQTKGKALRERDAIAAECCVRQYYIAKVSQNKESE
jgi:hypothetical protein